MAKNIVYLSGDGGITRRVTVASTVVSGDLVELGDLHGIAITSYDADDGKADVSFPGIMTIAELSVHAANNGGDSAVVFGDKLYYDAAATPDELNKDVTNGKLAGYAFEAIDAGGTETIEVALTN